MRHKVWLPDDDDDDDATQYTDQTFTMRTGIRQEQKRDSTCERELDSTMSVRSIPTCSVFDMFDRTECYPTWRNPLRFFEVGFSLA